MELDRLIEELLALTRRIIADKYSDWGYHNLDHFEETVAAAKSLQGKLKPSDWVLLMIAVAFHDVIKEFGCGKDEQLSADMAEEWMIKQNRFSNEEMSLVKKMIMGTVTKFEKGWKMRQAAEDSENEMVRLMADIDLINMGAEWDRFELRIRGLWQECGYEENEIEMWRQQSLFFKDREYLTDYLKEISYRFAENKQKVNDLLAKKSKMLE